MKKEEDGWPPDPAPSAVGGAADSEPTLQLVWEPLLLDTRQPSGSAGSSQPLGDCIHHLAALLCEFSITLFLPTCRAEAPLKHLKVCTFNFSDAPERSSMVGCPPAPVPAHSQARGPHDPITEATTRGTPFSEFSDGYLCCLCTFTLPAL